MARRRDPLTATRPGSKGQLVARALHRLLRSPRARALAALGAALLAVQSAGISLAIRSAPECCCARKDAHCRCKACTHARELESAVPSLTTCALTPAAAVLTAMDPAFPAEGPRPPAAAPVALAKGRPRPVPAAPPLEVPTPPPLART